MDGSGYDQGYGHPGWPYLAAAMAVGVHGYPAAMQPYGVAYGSLVAPVPRGPAHYGGVLPYRAEGFSYGTGAVPRAAEDPEAYDELWYQGFYRGYDGEHGEENVERMEAPYGELSNADYEELDGEGAGYDEAECADDATDKHDDKDGVSGANETPNDVYSKTSNFEGLKTIAAPVGAAKEAAAAGANLKTGTHRLNPAARTFLNPGARTFVPPTKTAAAAGNGSKSASAAASVATSAGAGGSTLHSEKLVQGGQAAHRDKEPSGQVATVQMTDDEIGKHASSSLATGIPAGRGAENANDDGNAVEGRCASTAESVSVDQAAQLSLPAACVSLAATEEGTQLQQRQDAEASSLHKPGPIVKSGRAWLANPNSLSSSVGSDSAQGASAAGDDPARLSGESLPRTAAHQSAVAIVEQQRPGEEHVAAPGLAAGGPAETLVSQAGGSVKAQGEPATSQTLTMSDMRPVSTPFRCFMTGLFSLFQGPRGEYGVESLWWVLDSRNGGESEPLDGKFTEYGLQANTSAASPSAKQQQQQQQQGQQHTVTGPYSSEQMILAYIAQALPHELLVCGTRGCSPPALLPSAESFRPLGLLLDAADAGKPYELLQL